MAQLEKAATTTTSLRSSLENMPIYARAAEEDRECVHDIPFASVPGPVVGEPLQPRDEVVHSHSLEPNPGHFHSQEDDAHNVAADLIDFDGPNDPSRPRKWPLRKKIRTTALYSLTTMAATWASACYSAGTRQISQQFHIGTQTATLGTSLFLFGFGVGPLLWAPFSEVYGRKPAVIPQMFIAACFTFGTATAKDVQTIMITRFFAAFFASAPVTNTRGVLADLFPPSERGIAAAFYSLAVVIGPVLGPIIGSILVSQGSWRWTEYLSGILMIIMFILDVAFLDESYAPRLLVSKARRLRLTAGQWSKHAPLEEWDVSFKELAHKFLVRPFRLLGTPICTMMVSYASFTYGILYMNLGSIPIIFQQVRKWEMIPASLPFLGLLLGVLVGVGVNIGNQFLYNKKSQGRVIPELRLYVMMPGAVAFAAGLFLTGWTASPEYPWIAPVIGLVLTGLGFITIFQSALSYLVDTFPAYAASVVAANTLLRSIFAGAFPLVVSPLYGNVGVAWGTSILALVSTAMIPVPFIFFRYGKTIREKSEWHGP